MWPNVGFAPLTAYFAWNLGRIPRNFTSLKEAAMKSAAFVSLLCLTCLPFAGPSQAQDRSSLIVSTAWLAGNLNDPNLVILHVANTRRDYLNGHIPGARFLWTGWFAQSNPELTYELVSSSQLKETVEELGIDRNSRIVLCFSGSSVTITARMYLTLDYLGLGGQTSFLDGGFELWKAEGRPVSNEAPSVKRSSFTPYVKRNAVVTVDAVRAATTDRGTAIIDARSERFYEGNPGGMSRGGHVPTAVNIPFSSVVDSTNKFLRYNELKAMFEQAGVTPGKKVITYCHIGQQASLLYFVARYLGHDASLYDGSFEDWSSREELPVEVPEKKEP